MRGGMSDGRVARGLTVGRIPWTASQAYAGEPVAARRSRNLISGVFLGTGAVLAFTALLVIPGWQVTHKPAIATIGILVAAASALQVVFASHVPIAANHAASLVGTATVAAAQVLAGYPTAIATVGLLYVWVAVFTAVFYSTRAAFVHVGIISAAQVAVVVYLGDPDLIAQVVVTVATCVTATFIVSWLIRDLRRQVSVDPLTGLANRRGLDSAFARAGALCLRERTPLAVAVVDLDGFKAINDALGHAAGDRMLVSCASAWLAVLRPVDVLARTGGDEFTIVMPGCSAAAARRVADRVRAATPDGLACSIGVVIATGDCDRTDILHQADITMYQAKQGSGRKIVVVGSTPSAAA